jgi:hypothetical protein
MKVNRIVIRFLRTLEGMGLQSEAGLNPPLITMWRMGASVMFVNGLALLCVQKEWRALCCD